MKTLNRIVAILVASWLAGIGSATASETLPQLARRSAPKPVLIERMRELLPEPFEQVVAGADLIVHGTAMPVRTYLSEDENSLFTDYLISPLRVMFQKSPTVSAIPGVAKPIIVKRWGGKTVINGVDVSETDRDAPAFDAGIELVLCLALDVKDGTYHMVSDVSGTFAVKNGTIVPLVNDAKFDRFKGTTIEQLAAEVQLLRK
jgi:hypothetical protein